MRLKERIYSTREIDSIDVMISIQALWTYKIILGTKNMELRKNYPTKISFPFTCYVYVSKTGSENLEELRVANRNQMRLKANVLCSVGKVIGQFMCRSVEDFSEFVESYDALLRHINLYAGTDGDYKFLREYIPEKKGYGWEISDFEFFDRPISLSELGLERPPQSWCYVITKTTKTIQKPGKEI